MIRKYILPLLAASIETVPTNAIAAVTRNAFAESMVFMVFSPCSEMTARNFYNPTTALVAVMRRDATRAPS